MVRKRKGLRAKRLQRVPARPAVKDGASRNDASLVRYRKLVAQELKKKLVPLSSRAAVAMREDILRQGFKSKIHPRACAGVMVMASGAPNGHSTVFGLCCGQR